jgi:hypothetical protein
MTISKRNKIHRQLATTCAQLSRYLGVPGQIAGEIETQAEYDARTRSAYARALTLSVPLLRQTITAARAAIHCCPNRIGI